MDSEKSYSEAMNEWARKNSFFGNRGNRLIHPNPALSGPLRFLGYLIRVVALAFILWVLVNFGLRKYVGSKGYGEKVGDVVAAMVNAGEYESTPLVWKGKRMSLNHFSATGGDDAFYHTLRVQYARFNSSPLAFLGSEWKLDEVVVNVLDVRFRSGAKVGGEVPVSARDRDREGGNLLFAGFAAAAGNGKSLEFESLKVLEGDLEWGLSAATRGGLEGAGLVLTQTDSGWNLEVRGGVFRQSWLQGVKVEKLTIVPEKGGLRFRNGEIAFASGGMGTLEGTVMLGELPKLDLKMGIAAGALSDLLPVEYHTYAAGRVDGELRLTGSINTRTGVEIGGRLNLSEGILRNIDALDSTSILTETTRLRNMPVTSGTVDFTSSEGNFSVTALDVISKETARMTGSFTFARDLSKQSEAEIIGLSQEGGPDRPLVCEGTVRLGVLARSLVNAREIGDLYFSPEQDGYRWMDMSLKGEMPTLTKAIYNRMVIDIRKLREGR